MKFEEKCKKFINEEYSEEKSNSRMRDAVLDIVGAAMGNRSFKITKLDTTKANFGLFEATIKDQEFQKTYRINIKIKQITKWMDDN